MKYEEELLKAKSAIQAADDEQNQLSDKQRKEQLENAIAYLRNAKKCLKI